MADVKNICFLKKYGGRKKPNYDSEYVEASIRHSRILLDGFSHVGFYRLLGTLRSRTINTCRMISSEAILTTQVLQQQHQYTKLSTFR
jgi:hypothetical protein